MRRMVAVVLVAIAGAATGLAVAAPASASPGGSPTIGSGDLLRAQLYEHNGGGGHVLTVKGTTVCTKEYSDRETSWKNLVDVRGVNFNDAISFIKDFNKCDVRLYKDANFLGGPPSIWYNGGGAGVYVGDPWNDEASSIEVS
jgi:hypothetical protein